MTPLITGAGTAEEEWRTWELSGPELELPDTPPLVVAPHPDDEVLGAGGLLARLADGPGAEIVAVTDGEASHPHSTVHRPDELAALRRAETDEALRRLGLSAPVIHRLGHPDGGVDEATLADALTRLLTPGRWCLASWRGDGHPDHEAVGRAAAAACATTGARLVEYPIWTWHWARPADPRVPWDRCSRLPLSDAERAAKRHALDAFVTQIRPLGPRPEDAPILPPDVLARFDRSVEVFFR
ncbi:N-acetylglucosaminyl deacetylase, LmbE family [Cryptosporangium aurantiacum]|uniref:N-acetylglucosaminyl deacetylase, LmbE family n=1 Tax=Cryptosporangium aurantiacum TaxID=134849 RepID=A0A1M7RP87_9ACTN|nr:PIG-L family deacetylase [Cryptosporangium aurantiacum]SHN48039.1 N-acetylglucosaminyl deacetylase, LmbE family [Cryptosporangium aurantiacum]